MPGRRRTAALDEPSTDATSRLLSYTVDTPEGPVGVLDELRQDEEGRPVALVVAQGWFGRRRVSVPIEALVEVDHPRGRINLAPGAAAIEHRGLLKRLLARGDALREDDATRSSRGDLGRSGGRRPVLCALAEEEGGLLAVRVGAELARGLDVPLILAEDRPPHLRSAGGCASADPADRTAEAAVARHTLETLLSTHVADTQVSRLAAIGPRARTLAEIAAEADACYLVVVASGDGAGSRGSRSVVRDAPCPVVVVPAAGGRASGRPARGPLAEGGTTAEPT